MHFAVSATPGALTSSVTGGALTACVSAGQSSIPAGTLVSFSDPAGDLLETWDFLHHAVGARDGIRALT